MVNVSDGLEDRLLLRIISNSKNKVDSSFSNPRASPLSSKCKVSQPRSLKTSLQAMLFVRVKRSGSNESEPKYLSQSE